MVLASSVEFYAIKEEYSQLNDKRKAYEEAFNALNEQLRFKN